MARLKNGTINKYLVIASCELPKEEGCRESRVILVDRGGFSFERYIVAIHCEEDDSWASGHYTASMTEAWQVFAHIAHRYYAQQFSASEDDAEKCGYCGR